MSGENYFIKVDHLLKNYVQQQGEWHVRYPTHIIPLFYGSCYEKTGCLEVNHQFDNGFVALRGFCQRFVVVEIFFVIQAYVSIDFF